MDKQDKIRSIALQLFVAYGFHGTSTSLIAKEAKIANGTLFLHFISKEYLIIDTYFKVRENLLSFVNAKSENEKGVKETLKARFIANISWALENQLQSKYIQQLNSSPYFLRIPPATLDNYVKIDHELLRQGIKEGVIKRMPPDFIQTMLTFHANGVYHYLISNKITKPKQQKWIYDSFDLVWDMLT